MGFSKQFTENEIVFIINDKILNDSLVKKIVKNIKPNFKIGLDMKNVVTLNSALFVKYLNCEKYKLYNLKSEVITYLSLILKNGKLHSYMNFNDFKNNKRELIRRRFIVLN